jgi:hypothetical protein
VRIGDGRATVRRRQTGVGYRGIDGLQEVIIGIAILATDGYWKDLRRVWV